MSVESGGTTAVLDCGSDSTSRLKAGPGSPRPARPARTGGATARAGPSGGERGSASILRTPPPREQSIWGCVRAASVRARYGESLGRPDPAGRPDCHENAALRPHQSPRKPDGFQPRTAKSALTARDSAVYCSAYMQHLMPILADGSHCGYATRTGSRGVRVAQIAVLDPGGRTGNSRPAQSRRPEQSQANQGGRRAGACSEGLVA